MLLAIISAAACLAATTIMYSPKMRSFRYYRPVALFFLFEGIWMLADYAFEQIFPGNVFMLMITRSPYPFFVTKIGSCFV